tara:strand:- start:71 stop:370 length:300 start_codon:yes stop_codon:yes gene_type:complete
MEEEPMMSSNDKPHVVATYHASFMAFQTSDGRSGTEPYVHEYIGTKEGLMDCDCGDCGTASMALARAIKGLDLIDGYTIEHIDGHGSLIKSWAESLVNS